MTTNNNTAQARPGGRFTDPDGGTWVMLARGLLAADGPYWSCVGPTGYWSQRTQVEAEAAGLVPLVAAEPTVKVVAYSARPAPAPLDPGNPEHLRQVAEFLASAECVGAGAVDAVVASVDAVVAALGRVADRLDREQREAEQDAADRKLSEQVADAVWRREEAAWHIAQKASQATLARVRAERARAEEAEQDRKDWELATEIGKTQRHDFGLLAESYREEILRHILAGIRAGRAERQEVGQ